MADVAGTVSASISAKAGLSFLGAFLAALGAAPVLDKIRVSFDAGTARVMSFRFTEAVRDSVDPLKLGTRLRGAKLVADHPSVSPENRFYLVTGVARTASISVTAQDDRGGEADLELGLAALADVSPRLKIERTGKGDVTFRGEKRLAFGLELHELIFDARRQQLRLATSGAVAVRGRASGSLVNPVFIGGPTGSAFVDLPSS
jgi:hypothetical protein